MHRVDIVSHRFRVGRSYGNRENVNSGSLCTSFWSKFVVEEKTRVEKERSERVTVEMKSAEEAAEAAKKAADEAAEAQKQKVKEDAEQKVLMPSAKQMRLQQNLQPRMRRLRRWQRMPRQRWSRSRQQPLPALHGCSSGSVCSC